MYFLWIICFCYLNKRMYHHINGPSLGKPTCLTTLPSVKLVGNNILFFRISDAFIIIIVDSFMTYVIILHHEKCTLLYACVYCVCFTPFQGYFESSCHSFLMSSCYFHSKKVFKKL